MKSYPKDLQLSTSILRSNPRELSPESIFLDLAPAWHNKRKEKAQLDPRTVASINKGVPESTSSLEPIKVLEGKKDYRFKSSICVYVHTQMCCICKYVHFSIDKSINEYSVYIYIYIICICMTKRGADPPCFMEPPTSGCAAHG